MTGGSMQTADLEAIEDELAQAGVTATTINFLVWIDDANHRDWVVERASMLGEKHPSRTIVFDACPEHHGASVVRSDRDAVSHVTVQGERVEIATCGMSPEAIRDVAQTLAIPELPTVLWWTGGELHDRGIVAALLDIADALVVDSSGNTIGANALGELATFFSARPTVALRDLAWMRLRPWQDMIARFFDDPALEEEVFSIRRLHIVSGSQAEAFYLGGWIASRLGWTACGREEFCDRSGNRVPFTVAREGQIRRVRSIEIATETSSYRATISPDDPQVVTLHAEGKAARPERLATLAAIDNASLLERAILEPATDEIFETALRMVGSLLA